MLDARSATARRPREIPLSLLLLCVLALTTASCGVARSLGRVTELWFAGDSRELREEQRGPDDEARAAQSGAAPSAPTLLLIALDGVDRAQLYDMLRAGAMPELARLLGGDDLGSAHLDPDTLSCLPSSTMVAWATMLTGEPPARHGIAGNEYFVRETATFVAPVPTTITDTAQVVATYTDDYVNRLALVPTIYERMRDERPDVRIWVAMHQLYRGADRLILPDRTALLEAIQLGVTDELRHAITADEALSLYEELDRETVENTVDAIEDDGPPDVLTVYLMGTDQYAHVSREGPDVARERYLREVVDPMLGELREALDEANALDDRWVVVTSDHGHTQVVHDDRHSLSSQGDDEPAAVLRRAGFRPRPFALETTDDDFDAVLAYQGAMAYLYLADRSTCLEAGARCDWTRPPRYREDVLEAAEVLLHNDRTGAYVPELRGTLEMVLVREPRPYAQDDLPFRVYVGGGKTVAIEDHLARHPVPGWVALERRLRDLAVGPAGERAGDVLLIARNSDRLPLEERFYFSHPYRSWHGSPGRKDSEIPLVVARRGSSSAELARVVRRGTEGDDRQAKIGDLLVMLATDERATRVAAR